MAKQWTDGGDRMHGLVKDGDFMTPYGKDSSDINVKKSTAESASWRGGDDNVEHSLGATKGIPGKRASKNSS